MTPEEKEKAQAEVEEEIIYRLSRLADTRKSCEYLATFAGATILGNMIKGDAGSLWGRRIIFVACGISIVLSLLGATTKLLEGRRLKDLKRVLQYRVRIRNAALVTLLIAFIAMIAEAWTPRGSASCVMIPCPPGSIQETATPTQTSTPTVPPTPSPTQ